MFLKRQYRPLIFTEQRFFFSTGTVLHTSAIAVK